MKREERRNSSNEEEKDIKVIKAIDLINRVKEEPEPKFLWKGIPEGSVGLITGVAKTGKTTFAENLAISLSVGSKEFYGYSMDGLPRKVLFVNLEESYKLRSRRNQRQISKLSDAEIELFSSNYLSTPDDFPEYLNTEEDWTRLMKYIEASEAEVVFIDSLSHMCIGEIEKSVTAQKFSQMLRKYVSNSGKTIIVIHHNTKGNDKPIDQDNIAGSRFILQEFEFAYGLANIPTERGGNYSCMLYNKHIEKDDTTAFLYKLNEDGWVEQLGTDNKFNLYKTAKKDGRVDRSSSNKVYDFMVSQDSQGSFNFSTGVLKKEFVHSDTSSMSKQTFHDALNRLQEEDKIEKEKKGVYRLKKRKEDDGRKE